MKRLIYISILFLLFGCSSPKRLSFDTLYSRSGDRYFVNLELRTDSTFTLTKAYIEWSKKCNGTWTYLGNDKYKLLCNKEEVFAQISSGYLEPREHIISILNNRKIKIEGEDTVLK